MSIIEETNEIPPTKLLASLAKDANNKIKFNKYILNIIKIYKKQIFEIKNILKKNKEENIANPKKDPKNIQYIIEYINNLKTLKNNYIQQKKKLNQKINEYKKTLFDDSNNRQPLETQELDNFILKNTLLKLNNDFVRYNYSLKSTKEFSVFREPKRDSSIDKKTGEYVIYDLSIETQREMLTENRAFNICTNKIKSLQKKIKEKNKNIEMLKNFILIIKKDLNKIPRLKKFDSCENIFDEVQNNRRQEIIEIANNKNKNIKKFKEDEKSFEFNLKPGKNKKKIRRKSGAGSKQKIKKKYSNNLGSDTDGDENEHNNSFIEMRSKNINLPLINKYDEENDNDIEESLNTNINKNNNIYYYKKDKKKKKFDLSKEELFNVTNYEGKNEEIIDEELHSNDEATFETKVISKKKIEKDYLNQIKKEIPSLNLSQIEFNKAKVINEADLYSLQKRNFEVNNIDGRIGNIKKKIKKLKKKRELNEKKCEAMRNYINELKNNYKLLRPLKIKSTVEGGDIEFKIQNLINKNDKNIKKKELKQSVIEEEGLVGSDYSDEDQYEDNNINEDEDNNGNINIIGDDDNDNNNDNEETKDNNVFMKTQAEIKTKIGLNLINNNNRLDSSKKNVRKKLKISVEDNSKFNSK